MCCGELLWTRLVCACEWGIYGVEWVLLGVVLLCRFRLVVVWGLVFCGVCNHCG